VQAAILCYLGTLRNQTATIASGRLSLVWTACLPSSEHGWRPGNISAATIPEEPQKKEDDDVPDLVEEQRGSRKSKMDVARLNDVCVKQRKYSQSLG
jgi:hypothetical protein